MTDNDLSEDRKQEILDLVVAECARAIGFDNSNSGDLIEQREKALQYVKGEMPDLVMQLAGRSRVVSTDVADAIETALPDLIDIFTGGDDVVAFEPVNAEDVEGAQQEQDYLQHVVFNRNPGWLTIYETFKDALTCKTGVFSWRWDGEFEPPAEQHDGVGLDVYVRCLQEGEVSDFMFGEPSDDGLPTCSFEFTPKASKGRVVIESVAPEDLAVGVDTKQLSTATYAAVRQRPRAQELLAMGYDADLIDHLPAWNNSATQPETSARDTVGESQVTTGSADDLRQVEIYRHYIRVWEDGEYCLYQVITGGKAYTNHLIDIQEVSRIQLAAITPYINPHRFYGDSVADKLMEIQKIKSSLMRMSLDSGYFALNQRSEVSEEGMTADTLNDLLANEPGMPVRVKRSGTVTPLGAGALNYDPLEHLEYFSVEAEKRTGIQRVGPGLNADTLHDTKGGLELLNNNMQKRLRLIARTFAETGYKDFLINLHATIRENGASMRDTIRLRDQWVDIDPSTWRQRDDMTVQIGVGAGGREHDIIVGQQMAIIQEKLLMAQNEPDGPLVNKQNLYKSSMFVLGKLGVKAPELYVSDPSKFNPPQPPAPPPDPQLIKVQQDGQRDQAQFLLDVEKSQHEATTKEAELTFKAQQQEADQAFKRWQIQEELAERQRQFDLTFAQQQYMDEQQLQIERERVVADVHKHAAQLDHDKQIADKVQVGGAAG